MDSRKTIISLKKFYLKQWKFFHEKFLRILIFNVILFILIAVLTHVYFINNPTQAENTFSKLAKALQKKIPFHLRGFGLMLAIFANNTIVSFLSFLLGFIPFLFLPFFFILSNGIGMGAVSAMANIRNLNNMKVFLGIFPHGILELPAVLFAASMGIYLSREIIKHVFFPEYIKEPFVPVVKQSFIIFATVITPLLLLAALIEAFVTPVLLQIFF